MTNVSPADLNYDKYSMDKYDRDIVNSIPYHDELHQRISRFVKESFDSSRAYRVLDLGVGTGITSKLIQDLLPQAQIDAVDFSKQMLARARKKLGDKNVRYILGDYADLALDAHYDMVVSVIGIHHQPNQGKKKLFEKIYSLLNKEGVFAFGDLVTYSDRYEAARNHALHYHHLVAHATDEKTLAEWAHHHMFLNDLAAIEDQIDWLEHAGFEVKKEFLKMNTALLFCTKN